MITCDCVKKNHIKCEQCEQNIGYRQLSINAKQQNCFISSYYSSWRLLRLVEVIEHGAC